MEKQQLVFCPPTSIRMNWLSSWSYSSVPCNVSVETAEMLADVPNIAGELTATGDGFNGLKSHSCVLLQIQMSVGLPFYSPKFHVCWLNPPRSIHWLKSRKSGRPTQAFASLQILQPQFCWTTEGKRNITNQNTLSHPFAFTVWAAKKVLWWKKNPAKAASRESQRNVKLIIANIWLYKMLISFSSPMLMMRVNKAYPRRIYLKEPGELRMTWELWEM